LLYEDDGPLGDGSAACLISMLATRVVAYTVAFTAGPRRLVVARLGDYHDGRLLL
jgi:hypothetical protein